MIVENNLILLDAMLNDQQNQTSVYQPADRWRVYSDRITDAIRREGLLKFRSSYAISKGYGDSLLFDPSTMWQTGGFKLKIASQILNNSYIKNKLIEPWYLNLIKSHYKGRLFFEQYFYDKEFGEWFSQVLEKVSDFPETPDRLIWFKVED
jgi:hypothetical protein